MMNHVSYYHVALNTLPKKQQNKNKNEGPLTWRTPADSHQMWQERHKINTDLYAM